MPEPTTLIREYLIERRGVVSLEEIRTKFRRPEEPLAWLVDLGVVIASPAGYQVKDGLGEPLERGGVRKGGVGQETHKPGKDKGFRGTVTTHRLSEGSARRAAAMNSLRAEKFETLLEGLRSGMTTKKAFESVGMKDWSNIRKHKPEEWKQIRDAQEEWREKRAVTQAAEFRSRLVILLQALGTATIDDIYAKTSHWQNGKQFSKDTVARILRAMRALGMADFSRTRKNENRWRAM